MCCVILCVVFLMLIYDVYVLCFVYSCAFKSFRVYVGAIFFVVVLFGILCVVYVYFLFDGYYDGLM